jgi:polysaccharide export outer membrane protein
MAYSATENYTVNPGDLLEITVWDEEKLHKEVRVLPDGTVSFPLSGIIKVAGKSAESIQVELTEKLKPFIAEPVVNVSVKSADGNVVYVLGHVQKPGQFVMARSMNIMQLLSLAGGLAQFAKGDDIIVLRKQDKQSEAIRFKYSDLEGGESLEKNYLLNSGDVIVVP